ncbi:Uncharacterised protein [Legionella steigerwaltii]|uniref:Ankyrin repeats (3 copies) n=1 Tax=Legionella steigerwaltii TaxID=460 RepID=A0A378LBL4_9GAMM|nr:hypothetical protein [Legionella steigerwaltii]KTD78663.1 hypothetical protein Lstg_1132 [Legionella steigerwaltii]STY24246.1 Uncharacterised protein [Legionella steigerwaltii]
MPISDDPNERLIYCATKGLDVTVGNILKKNIRQLQPEKIDEAINKALKETRSDKLSSEQIDKLWKIIIQLCNLSQNGPHPNPKVVKNALVKHQVYQQQIQERQQQIEEEHQQQLQEQFDDMLGELIKDKMGDSEWNTFFDHIKKSGRKPSQAVIGYALHVATLNEQWKIFSSLLSHQEPNWGAASQLLRMAAKSGQFDAVKLLCSLSPENTPAESAIKKAYKDAKRTGHHEIVSYLSCELIHQHNLEKDPLALTQAILQDYVDHSFIGSSFFNSQVKGVKNILSQVKRKATEVHDESSRNQIVLEVVHSLQKVMADNKELLGRVDFIKAHCGKIEESPSLKAEL